MSREEIVNKARESVLTFDNGLAVKAAKQTIVENEDISYIIEEGFAKAMLEVGTLFETKKLFLPHVMKAAEVMNAGLDILTPELEKNGVALKTKGTVVIATVEGDVHSIGKDICAVMLKIGGYSVINLGKDVPIKTIVQATKENRATIVATSALMTSTMKGQKDLEELLMEEGLKKNIKSAVGGAPVSQEWADEIGADIYASSSSEIVEVFNKALGQ
jgi:trimethylamine corrinoid protein